MSEMLQLPRALRDVAFSSLAMATLPLDEPDRAAYERGLRDGERKLSEQLLQQRTEFMNLQTGLLESLRQTIPHVVRDSERHLIELAIEVAQKLIADMPVSGEMVEKAVRQALGQVEEGAGITVFLHAEDLALLQESGSPLLSPSAGGPQTCFQAAPEIKRGGCRVQTKFGTIDARRETKVELLKKELLG